MSTSAGERVRDLVVLIPGFLGFDHFGSFPYFAQTVGTAIRVALEMRGRRGLAVVPSQTVPAGSLADRQRHLLASLEAAVAYYAARKGSTLPRLHLVGHSTGGVDAELFTYRQALDGTPWSARENELRACLRSIVTVASPLQGTWLAESPLARWLGQGSHLPKDVSDALDWRAARDGLEGALQFGRALWALPACLRGDSVPFALLGGAAADLHPFVRFVGSLARHRELLVELRPDAMKTTVAVDKRDPWLSHVRRKSFVTVAALGKAAPAGRFFRLLHGLASAPRMAARDVERMASLLDRLVEDDGVAIVRSPRVPEISIDASASDGVVTSALQLLATPSGGLQELAGIVVADHIDVMGYFPADCPRTEGPRVNGFLVSGSSFRDAEFTALYRSVAAEIEHAIADSEGRSPRRGRSTAR